jgi:phosphoribosyl-ATP pyrophosphohydrolase
MTQDTAAARHVPQNSQSIGWINVIDEEGKVRSLRYDIFVSLLFKQESFRHMVDHARGGICEEAGEISTAAKRHVVYNKPFDRTHMIEEMGDLRFFLQALMNMYDISETEILQGNANKLSERYKTLAYSDAAANARADKTGTEEK